MNKLKIFISIVNNSAEKNNHVIYSSFFISFSQDIK